MRSAQKNEIRREVNWISEKVYGSKYGKVEGDKQICKKHMVCEKMIKSTRVWEFKEYLDFLIDWGKQFLGNKIIKSFGVGWIEVSIF